MEKILRGVLKYRINVRTWMLEQFQRVRDNPHPTALFFTCIDSRLFPMHFTQSCVGDMIIVRNAGNIVPHAALFSPHVVTTEPGAMELACVMNEVKTVIVCGHADCKAINCLYDLKDKLDDASTPLQKWVCRHGRASIVKFSQLEIDNNWAKPLTFYGESCKHTFEAYIDTENKFRITDKLSMVNCLEQLQNISSYPFMKVLLESKKVRIYAMWIDVYEGNVYIFSRSKKTFVEINENTFDYLLQDWQY